MNRLFSALIIFASFSLKAQILSEKADDEAWSYSEIISSYKQLDALYENALYLELGPSDAGRPLSLFLIQKEAFGEETALSELRKGKIVSLINNGIHPGESCGMDASLKFSLDLLSAGGPNEDQLIAIIPVYNIGGSLNRRPNTRANQNGPKEQGFRGNASNRDLNRDFIKGDALNTFSFWALFQQLDPHVFIDTHTSNGADYPYTLSLIASQQDKLAPPLRDFMYSKMVPALFEGMSKTWPMVPYVNVFGRPPNDGYAAFLDLPRYASGYTSLFHCLSFITEAHMFKPYPDRVAATYEFLQQNLEFCENHADEIATAYQASLAWEKEQTEFPVNWQLDSSKVEDLDFNAYHYSYEQSDLGNYKRLKYHRNQEEKLQLDYYPKYKTTHSSVVPKYYVIPQAWREVVLRLQYQGIKLQALKSDTVMEVRSSYLKDWIHATKPYEGHFRTEVLELESRLQKRKFLKGDYLVPSDQTHRYFLATVLDPLSADSYLSWGFFDIIFQQKEYFSPYVFEDKAEQMLAENPELKEEFEAWKKENPNKLGNSWEVLSFFYKRSEYYENEHLRYPIAEIR